MKSYNVIYTISGRAEASVEAESLEEAYKKAKALDIVDFQIVL